MKMKNRPYEDFLDERLKDRQFAFIYLIESYNDEDPEVFKMAVADVHRALSCNIVDTDHE
jgi:hypothetical protein